MLGGRAFKVPTEKSPSYRCYPSDFLNDEWFRALPRDTRDLYRELIDRAWINCGLPADPAEIAKLCGEDMRYFKNRWLVIGVKFPVDPMTGRRVNLRQEIEREKQRRFSESQGKKARDKKHGTADLQASYPPSYDVATPLANPIATPQLTANFSANIAQSLESRSAPDLPAPAVPSVSVSDLSKSQNQDLSLAGARVMEPLTGPRFAQLWEEATSQPAGDMFFCHELAREVARCAELTVASATGDRAPPVPHARAAIEAFLALRRHWQAGNRPAPPPSPKGMKENLARVFEWMTGVKPAIIESETKAVSADGQTRFRGKVVGMAPITEPVESGDWTHKVKRR